MTDGGSPSTNFSRPQCSGPDCGAMCDNSHNGCSSPRRRFHSQHRWGCSIRKSCIRSLFNLFSVFSEPFILQLLFRIGANAVEVDTWVHRDSHSHRSWSSLIVANLLDRIIANERVLEQKMLVKIGAPIGLMAMGTADRSCWLVFNMTQSVRPALALPSCILRAPFLIPSWTSSPM